MDKFVVGGVGVSDLRKGPGHYPQTPLPGQPGTRPSPGTLPLCLIALWFLFASVVRLLPANV